MPEISRFYGIVIRMWPDDHPGPHFHARFGSDAVRVHLSDGTVTGYFPARKLTLVRRWLRLHRSELRELALAAGRQAAEVYSTAGLNMRYDEWIAHDVPVVEARHVRDYVVWLRFEDGVEGEADLSDLVFRWSTDWVAPLRDVGYFKTFKVIDGSIEWPNRFDVAPESLHLRVLGRYPFADQQAPR